MSSHKKRGIALAAVPMVILTLVMVGLYLTLGSVVQEDVRDDQAAADGTNCASGGNYSNCSFAVNASIGSLQGLDKVGKWQKTWGTVIGVGVVLGILGSVFVMTRRG